MRIVIIALALFGVAISLRAPIVGALLIVPIVFATLHPNNEWLGPVVSSFKTDDHQVWLTIDDGPTDDTLSILDLLDRHDVNATFFVKGVLAAAHPDRIAEIARRGHTIGNHSHTHPSATFWCLPPHAIAREIDQCNAVIPPTKLFRAPIGHKNLFVHPLLRKRGMALVGFSARAFDAIERNPDMIASRITRSLRPGAIVVLHQGREWSLPAMEKTIAAVRERGYSFRNTNR